MSLLCDSFPSMDSICVDTGEVKVSKLNLTTSFVNTCTVIAFEMNEIKFMAHIDAINPNMEKIVLKNMKNLDLNNVSEVKVWKGTKCENYCPSFNIAENILKKFPKRTKILYFKANNDIIKI